MREMKQAYCVFRKEGKIDAQYNKVLYCKCHCNTMFLECDKTKILLQKV